MKNKNEIKIRLNKIERKLWWCSFYSAFFERMEGVKNNPKRSAELKAEESSTDWLMYEELNISNEEINKIKSNNHNYKDGLIHEAETLYWVLGKEKDLFYFSAIHSQKSQQLAGRQSIV